VAVGLGRNLKEHIGDRPRLELVFWRLLRKDQTDHRAILLYCTGNLGVVNLEPGDRSLWDLLDYTGSPHAIVASGSISSKEIIDLVVLPEVVGQLGGVVIYRFVGLHSNEQAVAIERGSGKRHVHGDVPLLLVHVRQAGRAAGDGERNYVVDDLSVPGTSLCYLNVFVFREVGRNVEILVFIRPRRIQGGLFGDLEYDIGFADDPSVREGRGGRQIGGVAFGGAVVNPGDNLLDLVLAQTAII